MVCTALYQAEHSDRLILRLFETSGCPAQATVQLGTGITTATEVNFLENPTGAPVQLAHGKATVIFHPYEVKTLLVACAEIYPLNHHTCTDEKSIRHRQSRSSGAIRVKSYRWDRANAVEPA